MDLLGRTLTTQAADSLGGLLFRDVPPGSGYRVRALPRGTSPTRSRCTRPRRLRGIPPSTTSRSPLMVMAYLTTRDGTRLAIDVHPPQDVTKELPGVEQPPTPLPRRRAVPDADRVLGLRLCRSGGPHSGIAPLANLMGFAVVDVNMRGTGCSGGAYDYFEPLQGLDGYDVIETVAHQPWVLDHKVGMMGISYGGISQLFTAQTRPADLAAISPLSVIDQTATTLYPGGILNTGFALAWSTSASTTPCRHRRGGQPWAYRRIQQGDEICKQNQVLHGEAVDLLAKTRPTRTRYPRWQTRWRRSRSSTRSRSPSSWPASGPTSRPAVTVRTSPTISPAPHKWLTFSNGVHTDSLDP